jgi:hypothetical protein
VLLGILASCALPGPPPPGSAEDRDEAAVYAVVIDSVLASTEARFVVVTESTYAFSIARDFLPAEVRHRDPAFPMEAITDYEARNRAPVALPVLIPARTPIRRLRLATFMPPGVQQDEAYARFRIENAPATYLHVLSRPGFDPARRRAVVTTASGCGGLCGYGQTVLLARIPGGWRVIARDTTW